MIGLFVFLYLLGIATINNVAARLEAEGIVGGVPAVSGQFAYVVSIHGDGEFLCTGGIIDDQHVLTAAHCFCDENGLYVDRNYQVLTGISFSSNDTKASDISVESICIHPRYLTIMNDIAIMQVKLPNVSLPYLAKLQLPSNDSSYDGTTAVVVGYGDTRVEMSSSSENEMDIAVNGYRENHLDYSEIDIVPITECAARSIEPVYSNEICGYVKQLGQHEWKGLCSGDSGAPLVIDDNLLIGIVSRGSPLCRDEESPTIYTKVFDHRTFIRLALAGRFKRYKVGV